MSAVALLLIIPLVAGFVSLGLRHSRLLHGINLATMLLLTGAQAAVMSRVLREGTIKGFHNLILIDALSAFILLIIAVIGLVSSLYTWSYFEHYRTQGGVTPARMSRYFFLFHMFMFAMILATVANSLGVLWVAIEATTLATTFMINFFKRKTSLEAGWKYFILCSVGITLALLGTVLMYMSSVRAAGGICGRSPPCSASSGWPSKCVATMNWSPSASSMGMFTVKPYSQCCMMNLASGLGVM